MKVIQLRVKDLWWCSGLLPLWTVIGSVLDGATGWELFLIPHALFIQLSLQLLLAGVAATVADRIGHQDLLPWTNRTALVVLTLALLWPPLMPALTDGPELAGILTQAGMSSDAAGTVGLGLIAGYLLSGIVALIVVVVEGTARIRRDSRQQPNPSVPSPRPAR